MNHYILCSVTPQQTHLFYTSYPQFVLLQRLQSKRLKTFSPTPGNRYCLPESAFSDAINKVVILINIRPYEAGAELFRLLN